MRHIEDNAFLSCEALQSITFAGDALETIGSFAFSESGLETFTAPASLTMIGNNAFTHCEALRHVDLGAC